MTPDERSEMQPFARVERRYEYDNPKWFHHEVCIGPVQFGIANSEVDYWTNAVSEINAAVAPLLDKAASWDEYMTNVWLVATYKAKANLADRMADVLRPPCGSNEWWARASNVLAAYDALLAQERSRAGDKL